jgi:cysteinyl-tRNA synthetase
MDDFFNTAKVLSMLPALFKTAQEIVLAKGTPPAEKARALRKFRLGLKDISAVLGILDEDPSEYVAGFKTKYVRNNKLDLTLIEAKIKERTEARKSGNYARADALRGELTKLNILLHDKPEGTDWSIAV